MKKEPNKCNVRRHNGSMLYRIGMFAAMNHITIKTLRYYEEQGLLAPAFVDDENGYRYYTMDQMATLHQISALKEAGLSLDDIKKVKAGVDAAELLAIKKKEILSQIASLSTKLARLEGYLGNAYMSLDTPVLIKKIAPVVCATMQARIESYDNLFDAMPAMGAEMERLGCECAVPEYCFTAYPEPGYKEDHILVDTCEAVTEKLADSDIVKFREFPEIMAACIYHKGPYEDFPGTYERILQYIEENQYEICGSIREVYIDGIWNKETKEEWLSEIQIPVRKTEE